MMEPQEWNFDSVAEEELVACCYWEYARESPFILDLRRRCLDPKWKKMGPSELWKYCGHDIEKIQSIRYESEVFLRGFFFPAEEVPDEARPSRPKETAFTGAFPKPWQALTPAERNYRKHISNDIGRMPLVPFQRGLELDAQDIVDRVRSRRTAADLERETAGRENPRLTDAKSTGAQSKRLAGQAHPVVRAAFAFPF
jgi:hypothetical protein